MLVESAKNSFCRGSVVMATEMPGCDTVTYRTLTAWVHARDEISVDIYIISFAIKKQCHVTIEIFFINRIFDIFIYLQIIFYRNGGGKMDEITVGPRLYPPTLWYNVIEIHNLLQQNHLNVVTTSF